MPKLLRQKKITLIIALIIGIILIIISISFLFKFSKNQPLNDFKILNVENIDGALTVVCENDNNFQSYNVIVKDAFDNTLLEQTSTTNRIDISSLNIAYQQKVYISVIAKNPHEVKNSTNTYEYISYDPSFNEQNSHIANKNQPFTIQIDGDLTKDKYHLYIKYRDITIYNNDLTNNTISVPYDYLDGYNGRLTAYIVNFQNQIVNEFNFYVNPVLVGNVFITSPSNNSTISWDDIIVNYQGGDSATSYQLKVYNGKKLIGTFIGQDGIVTIPASKLKPENTYQLVLQAIYNDYEEIAKTSTVTITVKNQEETSPVTINYNYKNLKPNTRITLSTGTPGATIKYTLDGRDPKKYGATYTEPILITRDVTLKAIAIKNNQINSVVTSYPIHIGHKSPVVYLSPSNQYGNIGVAAVGYTNERDEMNKIADYVEERLKASGITVYRNTPTDSMETWVYESLRAKADLHLAIHSNASGSHNYKGMEIFVDNKNSTTMSMAAKIYNNLYAIYPNKDATTDRGIKYAEGRLGEVRPTNLPNGILIEIAHHDYPEDAKWLVDKRKEIGYNIANSIIDYFQMN